MKGFVKCQKGFTLIEVAIVVAVLGILIALLAPNLSGSKDATTASLLIKRAQEITNNWSMIAQSCGTPTTTTSPVIATGMTALDVIFTGSSAVAASYAGCYNASGVRPMPDAAYKSGSNWLIQDSVITLSGGGQNPLLVQYTNVPDSVVLNMVQKFNPSKSSIGTSETDTTSQTVRYTASTNGVRTVTVVRHVN